MACKKSINVVNLGAKTINIGKEPLNKGGVPLIPPPPSTHIKVCTPEQLRSIRPLHPCEPPVIPRPSTTGEKAVRGILFFSKILLLIHVIKWTDDLGIWGSTEESMQIINDAFERFLPLLREGKKDDTINGDNYSGRSYGLTYNLATLWNNTVSNIFYALGIFPVEVFRKIFHREEKEEDEELAEAAQNVSLQKTELKVQQPS